METRRNEESDFTTVPPAEMPTALAAAAEELSAAAALAADGSEVAHPQGGLTSDGAHSDPGDAADSADPAPPAGESGAGSTTGQPDGSDPAGAGESGTDGSGENPPSGEPDDPQPDGEGEPGGDADPDEPEEPQPDQMDNPDAEGGSRFAERFLTSGGVPLSPEALLEHRENLAVILLGLVMELLTGRLPADRFIPLMDAAKAYEAIKVARAEGEIAGRNAVIEEQLVAPPVGAPDLAGTPIARSRRSATSIFDLAEMAR